MVEVLGGGTVLVAAATVVKVRQAKLSTATRIDVRLQDGEVGEVGTPVQRHAGTELEEGHVVV